MDCRFFKDKMGPYLEGELPAGDLSAFKGHLETCPQCRKDLEDLEKTRAYLGALEEVEPPAWFEQKVMAGVREAHERKSVWRRLFYPLHVKVPVQALATIIVVVFAVHVFRDMEPQMKSPYPVQAPPAPAGEPAQKREAAPPPVSPAKKPAAPAVKAPAVPAEKPAMVADAQRQAVQAEKDAVSQSVSREYKAAAKPDLPAAVPPLAPAEEKRAQRGGGASPGGHVKPCPAPGQAERKVDGCRQTAGKERERGPRVPRLCARRGERQIISRRICQEACVPGQPQDPAPRCRQRPGKNKTPAQRIRGR